MNSPFLSWISKRPKRSLQDGHYRYKTKFTTGFKTLDSFGFVKVDTTGQYISLLAENTLDDVVISEEIQLDKNTLQPISRLVKQGGVEISIAYTPDRIDADYVVRSQLEKCVLSLDEPILTDGIAEPFWLSTLDLHVGESARFLKFNTLERKLEQIHILVKQKQKVSYNGQEVDAFEFVLTNISKHDAVVRYLISADERRLVLYEQEFSGQEYLGRIERWLL